MSRAAYLLATLLTRYQRGHVDQAQAAKMLGIRKADFAELVAFKALERAAWAYYLERFNYQFPQCDRRAVMRPLQTGSTFGKGRTFTDNELLSPPKREREMRVPA